MKIVVLFALLPAACATAVRKETWLARTPHEVAERFAIALNEQDWGAIYDSLSKFTRRGMDKNLLVDVDGKWGIAPSRRGRNAKLTPERNWSPRDRWIHAFEMAIEKGARIQADAPYEVIQVKCLGGVALAEIQTGSLHSSEEIYLVLEDENWRLEFFGPGHGGGMTWDDDRWWFPTPPHRNRLGSREGRP